LNAIQALLGSPTQQHAAKRLVGLTTELAARAAVQQQHAAALIE
jgi:hypothetical protein